MNRLGFALGIMLVCVNALLAQRDIRPATIKKVDREKDTLVLALSAEMDLEVHVLPQTFFMLGDGQRLTAGLKDERLKPGTAVMFKSVQQNGRDVLVGLRLLPDGKQGRVFRADPEMIAKLKPLTDLAAGMYQGHAYGLYPGGSNERPPAHEKAGVALARTITPLDGDGKPDPQGKIVLLSIGMSNTGQVSQAFQRALQEDSGHNPRLVFVNGAQGGMTASRIQDPEEKTSGAPYWSEVDARLRKQGVTRAQVQAVWIKQADAGPSQGFPKYAQTLQAELRRIVQILPGRFPNAKLAYLSSRTYGGFARTPLNPEPYAFESAFSVRWLLEEQLGGDPALNYDPTRGPVRAPWLSWGSYLWSSENATRSDGYVPAVGDFAKDGTHHSDVGSRKLAQLLLRHFRTDPTSQSWFGK